MVHEDNETLPSFLENESRGDRSNFKGTHYHLVYTIWLLFHEHASSVAFYRGNDLLVRPPREITDKILVPIRAQKGNEDVWIQLKSTTKPWTIGKLLEDNLLANFLYNTLLSERRGRSWKVRLITQGTVSRTDVEKFANGIEEFIKKAEFPPRSKGSNRDLLHTIITQVQEDWLVEDYSAIDEFHLYSLALNILRQLGRTEPVSLRLLEAEIKQHVAPLAPTYHAIQQLPLTLLGALVQATSPDSTPCEFTLEWLEQCIGQPLKIESLLDSDPVAACVKASRSALSRNWDADQCISRPRLQNALRQFLAASQLLFLLLGANKSGVTWAMADWTMRQGESRTWLLVKGEDFRQHRTLAALVAARLREPATAHLHEEQLLRKVLAGGNGQQPAFLLIIDGLVLRGSIDDLRYDLEKLVEDCRRHQVKLVLTCQKHAWNLKNPGKHIHVDDIFCLEEMAALSSRDEGQASPPYSFLLEDLTYDELNELLVRRLPSGRAERAVSQISAPAFTPLRNPYLLNLYVQLHGNALGMPHSAPTPIDVDGLLDTRVDHFLHEIAEKLECHLDSIRSAFDALVGQLWEKRPGGLTYKQAVDCLENSLPEQSSISTLQQMQLMGLLATEGPIRFTDQERPIAERLFAKWLSKQQQGEDGIIATFQPETDTGVITAFLRGVATDPAAWAERLLAQDDRWLPAITAGLAQRSSDDYRSLAFLTTLTRPKSRAIVGLESCAALGHLASREKHAWKWVAQMYVSGREEERHRGEAALATTMGLAPQRVAAAIRLRLSRLGRLDREKRERIVKDTLTPLLGMNHRVAAEVGRQVLQRYSHLIGQDRQHTNESFLETADHARGLIATFTGEVSDLLAQLRSTDSFTRFRAACALQPVVVEHPEWVQSNLLQALRSEQDPRVLGRLLQAVYRYTTTAPHDLLDALEECFVLRWDQVFRKATGMSLVVLSALTGAKQDAERAFHLLPQRPDIFEPWQQAFFSEMLAFAWWGCAEHVPQAREFLTALTRPDLTKIEDKFRPFALRGAAVAQIGGMCLSMGEMHARDLMHPKRVAEYFWVDTDEFAKRFAEPLFAHPDYARLQELLLECLHEGQRVHVHPIDPLYKEQDLCTLFTLEILVQTAIKQIDPLPLLRALPPDWPILHATWRLLEAGHTAPSIVQLAQDLSTRYANSATVQAYHERERCLSQLARLKGDAQAALEEHRTAQWHLLLKMNGAAHVLAELTDPHPDRMLLHVQQSIQSEEDLPTLYHWEEEARSWQGWLIARVYARMFDARPIRLIEARALCDQMLTAIRSLPASPERGEYEAVYGTIAAWLGGNRLPAPVLLAPHGLVQTSHTYATSLLQRAYEERPGEADLQWIADACVPLHGGLESSQFGIDDAPLVSVFGRFMRCVLPAVRLACAAIGQEIGLSDPAGRWLLERAQVDQLFLDYSWTRDPSVYQGNEEVLEEACAAFLASATRIPHDERLLQRCGALLIACNDRSQAEEILRRCISLPARDQQARTGALYDLACIYAMRGQEDQCREVLQAWSCQFPAGRLPREQLTMDPDFTAMHDKPWFHELGTEEGEDQRGRERS